MLHDHSSAPGVGPDHLRHGRLRGNHDLPPRLNMGLCIGRHAPAGGSRVLPELLGSEPRRPPHPYCAGTGLCASQLEGPARHAQHAGFRRVGRIFNTSIPHCRQPREIDVRKHAARIEAHFQRLSRDPSQANCGLQPET